jgi:hypothetical protein
MKATSQIVINARNSSSVKPKKGEIATEEPSPSKPFEQVFQNLMGKRVAGSEVNEEELFAASIGSQIKSLLGTDAYTEYKLSFKIGMSEIPPGRSAPSVERSAREALKDLVRSGILTREQARDIRDVAFAAAQLDDDPTRLFDGKGGDGDATVATGSFDTSAQLAAERMFTFQSTGQIPRRPTRSASVQQYRKVAGK